MAWGGANSVKAEKVKLYSTGFTEEVTGNCSYDELTKKFSWSAQYSNAVTVIKFTAGLLPYFSTVKLHVDGISEGGEFRIVVNCGSVQKWQSLSSTGDISINISDFQKWGTKITEDEIATAFEIRLSGSDGETHVGDWVQIDPTSIYLETSWDAPMSISSTSDWEGFSKFVSSGLTTLGATLTTDVDAGSTMVGADTDGKRYQGTFDGAGHTLSFTYEGGGQFVAPFSCIDGATITDLWTLGSITTSSNMPGGIVGKNVGNSTLTRCASSMSLRSTDSGNGRIGGLVGRCADGNQMTFNYCMFDGTISSATSGYACGFVGWDNQAEKITLNNCLVASTDITGGGKNFINNTPIIPDGKFAYYLTKFGSDATGRQLNEQLLNSGQAAWELNQGIADGAWFFGQGKLNASNIEACPTLTSDASKKVIRTKASGTSTNLYVNPGGAIPNAVRMKATGFKMKADGDLVTTIPSSFLTDDEEIYRTVGAHKFKVSSAGATTLIIPFNVASLPDGMTAYNLEFDGSSITATPVTSITADKPVLINAPEGEYKFESGLSGTIEDYNSRTTTNGALKGVYNEAGSSAASNPLSYVPAGAYVLQNGKNGIGFYRVAAENTIKITSFRAYLTAPSDAPFLDINFDFGEITSIADVRSQKEDVRGEFYNLKGQRISQPSKGLYIVNGKKYVVK